MATASGASTPSRFLVAALAEIARATVASRAASAASTDVVEAAPAVYWTFCSVTSVFSTEVFRLSISSELSPDAVSFPLITTSPSMVCCFLALTLIPFYRARDERPEIAMHDAAGFLDARDGRPQDHAASPSEPLHRFVYVPASQTVHPVH